jgi:hypothetical protein
MECSGWDLSSLRYSAAEASLLVKSATMDGCFFDLALRSRMIALIQPRPWMAAF